MKSNVTPLPLRRRVLVSLPSSGPSHSAIEAGRRVAAALDAPLHGLLVWPTAISPRDVPRLLRVDPDTLGGMVIDVAIGDPADRLRAAVLAQPTAFLVLSGEPHRIGAAGDLAVRALGGSAAGAIVIRPGASLARLDRILVPLDGTPSTAAALGPAGELAQRAGAALDVVLVEDAAAPPRAEPGAMTPQYVDQPQHEWPAFSAEFTGRFLGAIGRCPPGVPTRFFLGAGSPAAEILRFADELESDLVALVCHGGYSLGATSREVLCASTRPVLVLRGPAAYDKAA